MAVSQASYVGKLNGAVTGGLQSPQKKSKRHSAARGTGGAETPFPAMDIPLSIPVLLPSSSLDASHNGPACFPAHAWGP